MNILGEHGKNPVAVAFERRERHLEHLAAEAEPEAADGVLGDARDAVGRQHRARAVGNPAGGERRDVPPEIRAARGDAVL